MSQPPSDPVPRLPLPGADDDVIPFATAHREMRSGDLLFWRGNYLISRLFERATGGYYSHAAIAARWEGRLILLQAEAAGIQAVPLHVTVARYPGLVDWYQIKPEIYWQLDIERILHRAQHYLGLEYGYADVGRALAYRVFGVGDPHDAKRPRAMFCSEYVATAFRDAGLRFTNSESIDTMPQDIANSDVVTRIGTIHPDPSMPVVHPSVPPPSDEPAQPVDRVAEGVQGTRLDTPDRSR